MTSLNEMFDNNNEVQSTRNLEGTAALTTIATQLTNQAIVLLDADAAKGDEAEYRTLMASSRHDHSDMDKLIATIVDMDNVDLSFLDGLSEEELDKMLKSQQSKRSRSKSKPSTLANYKAMMTGAIAEKLIRKHTGKEKSAGGARRASGPIEYTEEQLAIYKDDQELLKKEIRNVQSKKSIMKAKGETEGDKWQELLDAEETLKSLRTTSSRVVQVDTTKNQLAEELGDVDVSKLKANDAKELLEKLQGLIK